MWRPLSVIGFVVLLVLVPMSHAGVADTARQEEAQPTEIDSCTSITESGRYVLTADIENSSDEACIDIQADDVVFDGDGHTLDGAQNEARIREYVNASYTGLPPNATDDDNLTANATTDLSFPSPTNPDWANVGIAVNASDSLSNVSITGVTVQEFFYGVYYDNVTSGTVRDVELTGNGDGIDLFNSSDVRVTSSRLVENQWGLYTSGVTNTTIREVDASSNGETGVYLSDSTVTVTDVTANENGASGIILDSINDSTVANVEANENRYGGIPVFLSENNTIRDSMASGNGHDGISLQDESVGNLLVDNTVTDTTGEDDLSQSLGYSAGITVTNSSYDNTIRNTTSNGNADWAFYANNVTRPNDVENLTIDSRVSVSFTGTDVALNVTTAPRTTEADEDSLPSGVFLANTSTDARVENVQIEWLTGSEGDESTTAEATPTESENETTENPSSS